MGDFVAHVTPRHVCKWSSVTFRPVVCLIFYHNVWTFPFIQKNVKLTMNTWL